MALGGGSWEVQNKVLPGAYINFASAARASATLSERGTAAVPLELDWGPEGTVFTVTSGEFQKDSLKIFGHAYTDDAMLPLREIFRHARTLHTCRLNSGGAKASCTYAEAKYSGVAGNSLSVAVAQAVDGGGKFEVSLYCGTTLLDTQIVSKAAELKGNDFVSWKSDAELSATAKTPLTGGTNGTVAGSAHQDFLDKLESRSFNTLGCPSAESTVAGLYVSYTKRMRDEAGAKFQTVIYDPPSGAKLADYEGVIALGSAAGSGPLGQQGLVYWLTGASAGCAVNASLTNMSYDGELAPAADSTQAQLEAAISGGWLVLHRVDAGVRVLEDINSLVTLSDTKGDVFRSNQTVRVCDQIANDIALLFNSRYLGTVPNDNAGRVALWNDICRLHQELESIRAIEGFNPDNVAVEQGETKKAVVCTVKDLNVINAMAQLYMSVIIT